MSDLLRVLLIPALVLPLAACVTKTEKVEAPTHWDAPEEMEVKNRLDKASVAVEGDCATNCSISTKFEAGEDVIVIEEHYDGSLEYGNWQTHFTINGEEGYETDPNTHFLSVATASNQPNEDGTVLTNRNFYATGTYMIGDEARYAYGQLDYKDYQDALRNDQSFVELAHMNDTQIRFGDVNWFYVTASQDGPSYLHGSDGEIILKESGWNANFDNGVIKIYGELDGTKMSGRMNAMIDDRALKGGAIGEVGMIDSETQTAGVFGGASINGYQSIAGGWEAAQ